MKKFYLIGFLALFFGMTAFGQKASEASRKSPLKTDGPCVVLQLEASHKNVEDVLKQKFKKYKTKSERGFVAIKGQVIDFLSSDVIDLYYNVEKKKSDQCEVIFFVSKGYDNFVSSKDEPELVKNVTNMLNEMVVEVRSYELQLAIDAQTKVLEDEVKDQEKLVKEGEDLVKEQKKLEEELAENKKDQEDNKKNTEEQKKVVEKEKKLLEELKKKLDQVGR